MDVLLAQDVPPEQAGQGGAEGGAEGAVVDAEGHGVDGGPEVAVGDGRAVEVVDDLPGLDDAREEDGGADVGAGELDARCAVLVGCGEQGEGEAWWDVRCTE